MRKRFTWQGDTDWRFSLEQVLLAIKKSRWPDNSDDMLVHFVRPDEGTWVKTRTYELSGCGLGLCECNREFSAEFYGPVMPLDEVAFRVTNFYLDESEYGVWIEELCYQIPVNSIVLQESIGRDGIVQRECIVSTDNHPQRRLDFDSPESRLVQVRKAA